MLKRTSYWVALTAIAGALSMGCSKGDDGKSAASGDASGKAASKKKAPKGDFDEATMKQGKALAGKVKSARFKRDDTTSDNSKAFVYLAGSSDKTEVVVASLRAMESLYTSRAKSKKRKLVDATYTKTVMARLGHADAKVRSYALKAARNCISGEKRSEEVVKKIIEIAKSGDDGALYSAMQTLDRSSSSIAKHPKVAEVFVTALDSKQPGEVATALFSMRMWANSYSDKDALATKIEPFLKNADPGIRGRAAQALATIRRGDKEKGTEAAKKILPLVDDKHPFTKSAACDALAQLKYAAAIPKIIKLVDDTTENRHSIKDVPTLEGSTSRVSFDGSAWSVVSDAAFYSLRRLSSQTKERFKYKINGKTKDADLKKSATDAKAWYAKVKGSVPKG